MRGNQAFSTKKYLDAQKQAIEKRMQKTPARLYLEFGGKLLKDYHAARTLPGYDPEAKLKLLRGLKKDMAVIYCISAKQLENGKIRGDWGIGYDLATIKTLEKLKRAGLPVAGVVINRYEGESEAKIFAKRLKRMNLSVHYRREIPDYPDDLDLILSGEGYGRDEYLDIDKQLIVVWGAGPGSGKLSTCLGQIYHDAQKGLNSGYAKLETFPVWDLDLNHSVNVAYEAATADLGDNNLIDPFHLDAYDKKAVNYNRDVEAFPIIRAIFTKLLPEDNYCRQYQSPTDMGVNLLSRGIVDEEKVKQAAKKEINFYLFRYRQEYKKGLVDEKVLNRMSVLMKKVDIGEDFLPTVLSTRQARKEAEEKNNKGEAGINCGAAIELVDGQVISGKNSPLLHAESAAILNSLKVLADIDDAHDLITKDVIKQVKKLKKQIGEKSVSLTCSEALVALTISAQINPLAQKALNQLEKLKNCFMHTTHCPVPADSNLFRKLNIWVSTDGLIEKIEG